ncbi:MAG: hypothetical protein G01um101433_922 [Parcubacteria group bacterium Gr01-1014_33]|nr:MAG: hypothetical protein G01um101433_922 [Parcubacteria group bacterium Gr01-1014_33]
MANGKWNLRVLGYVLWDEKYVTLFMAMGLK